MVRQVLGWTGGHPYATQELCYFLWEETGPAETADERQLEGAVDRLLQAEHAHFTLIWETASSVQRLLLQALAAQPGRPLTNAYRAKYRLPAATGIQKALQALTQRELVAKASDGTHHIAEPFLADWLLLNL